MLKILCGYDDPVAIGMTVHNFRAQPWRGAIQE